MAGNFFRGGKFDNVLLKALLGVVIKLYCSFCHFLSCIHQYSYFNYIPFSAYLPRLFNLGRQQCYFKKQPYLNKCWSQRRSTKCPICSPRAFVWHYNPLSDIFTFGKICGCFMKNALQKMLPPQKKSTSDCKGSPVPFFPFEDLPKIWFSNC